MKNYRLEYWRKDGIVKMISFDNETYKKLKGRIHKLIDVCITDWLGYALYCNGECIERQ
jgi:hypothetical protein